MRVLCATDLLPKSEAAIERAGMLAEQLKARVSLLHVVTSPSSERVLEQEVQQSIARLRARSRPPLWRHGSRPHIGVRIGCPAAEVANAAEQMRANLVVLGRHRARPVVDALRGTLAGRLATSRLSPVLIARLEAKARYRRVLLALDLSSVSAATLRAAESLILTPQSQASVIHAYDSSYEGALASAGLSGKSIAQFHSMRREEARAAVGDLLTVHSDDVARYEILLRQGRPEPAIRHAVHAVRPDLLIVGTRGRGRLRQALLGSVATQVLKWAKCDLLVVPDGSLSRGAPRLRGTHRRSRDMLPRSPSATGLGGGTFAAY